MAKRAAAPQAPQPKAEDRFVELMLVAADFVKNCGAWNRPKKPWLTPANSFIKPAALAVPKRHSTFWKA
jgi:hypothetical protein